MPKPVPVAIESSAPSATGSGDRLLSLDVFRGGTIAAMILVNNPGSWSGIYPPLAHADWHGWTFTDLVFPFFLWIVGVSITFSFAKRVARGDHRSHLLGHIVRRSVLIFLVGLALNLFPNFQFSTVRIPGVLQRIAICYLIAAIIFLFTTTRGRIAWIAGLLTSYWILMKFYPAPEIGGGRFEEQANFAKYIDGLFLTGHMWSQSKNWDPEGIVSTLPAIATTLFGIFAGQILRAKAAMETKAGWLFFTGNCLLLTGLMLSTWMPINKKLWTTPYSIFTAGLAFAVFACCYWLVDIRGWKRFARPFAIYGMNALAVYVLSGLVAKLLGSIRVPFRGEWVAMKTAIYDSFFAPFTSTPNASLLFALANVLFFYAIAYMMYKRNWFMRL